jgi:uncharacterized membrane protein
LFTGSTPLATALTGPAYELVVAPAVVCLALLHAARALGWRRAIIELAVLAIYGYALERTAIAVFGSHRYGAGWVLAPQGVPLAVAGVWAALLSSGMAVAARRGYRSPLPRATAAAVLAIGLDALMEPVAVRGGLWEWTPPGPWLGVPIGNFVGWAVIVGAYTFGAERAAEGGSLRAHALRRASLAVLAILALIGVGTIWRRLGIEQLFVGAGGWAVWATVLLGAASLRLPREPAAAPDTLAGRLGDRPVGLASAVFLVLAGAFTVHALLLGDRALLVVAAGTCVTLLLALPDSLPVEVAPRWRAASLAGLCRVRGLVGVLMKPRNGEAWTAEDRAFLRGELRALARWTPAFVLFLLPGSVVLLPAYAWLLDRRRLRRGIRKGAAAAL